jgi:molybdate transport repressor ModE-like protein
MTDHFRTALDWEDVRIFVALARHGSLSAAARALSVTHATISRRVQALEDTLGQKLVERRTDGYVLTPAGTQVLGPASDMEAAAAKLIRGGPDDAPRGLVRLNAPPSLTQGFLVAQLARLALSHPALDIHAAGDFRNVSLERHETDIALRLGRPEDGDVIAKFVAPMGYGFYASPEWRARIDGGAAPAFVGFDESNAHLPESVWLAQHFTRARTAFRANSQLAQAVAARAGAGVALLPHFLGRSDGGLQPCALEHAPPARELWMIKRRQDRQNLPVRTVADFLAQAFADQRALFE